MWVNMKRFLLSRLMINRFIPISTMLKMGEKTLNLIDIMQRLYLYSRYK